MADLRERCQAVPLGPVTKELNMTTQNPETLTDRAHYLSLDLSALDDFLHAVAGEPPLLYRQEADAAQRLHRQICSALDLARRIDLWLTFRPRVLMKWNGRGFDEIDTSGCTVEWAARSLSSIERFLRVNRREVKTLRKAARRVNAAASSDQSGRRTA